MALSNAERQRKHKENLKAQAANNTAFAEHRQILEGITGRLERAVGQVEHLVTARPDLTGPLILPPDEEERLIRIKQLRFVNINAEPEFKSQDHRFLGMSVQQWMTMPNELLAVFGLADVAAIWSQQANESIAPTQMRQLEDAGVEPYLTKDREGESDDGGDPEKVLDEALSQQLEKSTAPGSHASIEFAEIEAAYWTWLNCTCPYQASSEERRLWARKSKLPYSGTLWTRRAIPRASMIEKPFSRPISSWQVTFTGDDGRVIDQPKKVEGAHI